MSFIKATKNNPNKKPREFLLRSLDFFNDFENKKALDLGCGTMTEVKYLLEKGFIVDAVDVDIEATEIEKEINNPKLKFFNLKIEDFEFKENEYDLISCFFTLFHLQKKDFDFYFKKIIDSLKIDGIFTGNIFGDRDTWNTNNGRTFLLKEEIEKLFLREDIKIKFFEETEYDAKPAIGEIKHWHVFNFILCKK